MTGIITSIIGFIFGFGIAIFAEPIRQRIYSPKLELYFQDGPDCKAYTKFAEHSDLLGVFLRVRVRNVKPTMAKNCRAYLINIERYSEKSNRFEASSFRDSVQLAWSCKKPGEEYDGIDLAKDVNQYIDVVHTVQDQNRLFPHLSFIPIRFADLFNFPGKFRYTIQVSADQTGPKTIQIVFNWTGRGNDISIE